MKIRIKDNSVRLRLAQNEVSDLVNNGEVFSECNFMNNVLTYGIKASTGEAITCTFDNNKVTVKVPQELLVNWDTDTRVGFQNEDTNLSILVEKDWQCLKPRDHEDESNLYKHPAAN